MTTVPAYIATAGIDASYAFQADRMTHALGLYLFDSFIGEKHLDTAGLVNSKSYQRISAKLTYGNSAWKGVTSYLTAAVYPGSKLDEVAAISNGIVTTAPRPPVTITVGVIIPLP